MRRRESNGLRPSARAPRRVVFLATPCSSGVDLIGALDLLTVTNTVLRTTGRGPGYAPEVVAAGPAAVTAWPGNTLLFIVSVQAGGAAAQWLARAEIVVAVGALVLAGALAALPYAPPLALLVIAGLLGGLPAGALVAAPTAVLRHATRARGMGIFYTWYYAGMALLPPVAGWLQDTYGRTAAIHFAATAIFLAPPFYLVFGALVRTTAAPSPAESTA